MPNLIKHNNEVQNAKSFRNSLETDNLYLFFGKSSEWSDEQNPDNPVDSVSYDIDIRQNIIAIKKVKKEDTAFVVPRYDWVSGTVYARYSNTDSELFNNLSDSNNHKNFYVRTSSGNVYKCINNNSGAQSTVEPTGTSTISVTTGDGYVWKFMYNISVSVSNKFLTSEWMPVPADSQRTAFQIAVENSSVYAPGSPVGGHGASAIYELGANRVMISQAFESSESGILPVDDDFRQYGLWLNPKLMNDDLANAVVYDVNTSSSSINELTGTILYVNNVEAITRSESQTESFRIVQSFR